jgi:hypothetical protein
VNRQAGDGGTTQAAIIWAASIASTGSPGMSAIWSVRCVLAQRRLNPSRKMLSDQRGCPARL